MGLYDTLEFPAELSLPGLNRDPSTIRWQTKSIGRPAMRTFRITPDGRLLQEEFHTEEVPEEERPFHGTDKWDEPLFRIAGSCRRVHDGWSERQYHGIVRLTASVDGELLEYRAKFTDGRLVALRDSGGDDNGEWVPVETHSPGGTTDTNRRPADLSPIRSETARMIERPEDCRAYKRTRTKPIRDTASAYNVSIPDSSLTDTRHEERYLQIVHLPDDRDRRDAMSGAPIARGSVYELVTREPITINECDDGTPQPVSAIVERDGHYEPDTALRRAVELAESRQIPIHHEIGSLRPTHWSDASMWVTCPDCRSDEIMLVTNLDEADLTLACRACDTRVTETDREKMFDEWLHCPSCTSGDVNVELSAPNGGVWWSCDDCGYDTVPAPIDTAYTEARGAKPPGA